MRITDTTQPLFSACFIMVTAMSTHADSNHIQELDVNSVLGVTSNIGHLSQQPVRVELINQVELEANHAINLTDALKYTPGVQLRKLTGKSGEGVWLQGYDSNRVAVLIDGLPVAAGTGSSVDVSQIAIGDVERIEVSKGAMSAIYGTSAMGGVVNVITKKPKKGQHANLTLTGGSWGKQDEEHSRTPFGKQHIKTHYTYGTSQGYGQIFFDEQISNGFRIEGSDKTQGWEGSKRNLSTKAVYHPNNTTEFSIAPRFYNEYIQTITDNHVGGIGNIPKAKIDLTDKQHVSVLWKEKNINNGVLKVNVNVEDFYNESRQDTLQTERIEQYRKTDIRHTGFITHYEVSPNYLDKYIIGIEYLHDTMNVVTQKDNGNGDVENTIEVPPASSTNYNNFAQLSQQITPNLEWLISGRINNNDKYGMHFSPMINLQYLPNNLLPGDVSFRFGYGQGYRTPNIKELYYLFDHSHLGYVVVGNQNLKPESSRNIQTSFEWQPNATISFDATLFYNEINDLIDTNEVSALTTEFSETYGSDEQPIVTGNQYTNISNATTAGAEWTLSHKIHPNIKLRLAHAYLYSQDNDTGKTLPNRPNHDLKLGVDLLFTEKFMGNIKYNYLSEQYSDLDNQHRSSAFSQIDIKLNYTLSNNIKLFGGVDNVTSIQKETFDGHDLRPDEGRYIYLGLTLKNLID